MSSSNHFPNFFEFIETFNFDGSIFDQFDLSDASLDTLVQCSEISPDSPEIPKWYTDSDTLIFM